MTIKELHRNFIQQLQNIYSSNESAAITDMIFEKIAGVKKTDVIISPEKIPDTNSALQLQVALEKLLSHIPVQYVLGEAWFCNMKFFVNEHVLIPRPETEELVKLVIDEVRSTIYDVNNDENEIVHRKSKIVNIIDIGTGSGCIAIAVKKKLPSAEITAIDVSEDALNIAKENAVINEAMINFKQIDFLDENKWSDLPLFDAIVSNPPYIPINEKAILDKNVTEHEPDTALFVPNNAPLLFYEKIIAFAKDHLNPDGKIFVEIHENFGESTAAAFAKMFKEVIIKKDISGKDRMIMAATQFR
ncbi:MAG: peptide chain release factor N(5)-glutamine methyltransferase [Bacteroidota bacterium]